MPVHLDSLFVSHREGEALKFTSLPTENAALRGLLGTSTTGSTIGQKRLSGFDFALRSGLDTIGGL